MDRSYKDWQSIITMLKSRISAMKILVQNESVENQKKTSEALRKTNRESASKS
tara:strand:- start:640 stop:798 length:159 start_codon:yes stop_codon:yes gene_type:complete